MTFCRARFPLRCTCLEAPAQAAQDWPETLVGLGTWRGAKDGAAWGAICAVAYVAVAFVTDLERIGGADLTPVEWAVALVAGAVFVIALASAVGIVVGLAIGCVVGALIGAAARALGAPSAFRTRVVSVFALGASMPAIWLATAAHRLHPDDVTALAWLFVMFAGVGSVAVHRHATALSIRYADRQPR